MFAFRKFLVKNRLWIGIVLIALGIVIGIMNTWWVGWLPIFIGILTIVAHFIIGPVTLLQKYIEDGDIEGAKEMIDMVKYPKLLLKPIRSAYYMIQGNFSAMTEDLDTAENSLRQSLTAGTTDKSMQGTTHLQLGSVLFRKGNNKEAFEHLKKAVGFGLPDPDSIAAANLYLCQITMQRRDFRSCKMYFAKAQAAKAKNPQIVEQIIEMKKYIARIPG